MKKVCFLFFVLSVQKIKEKKKTAGLILDDIEGYCLISWMAIWHRTKIIPFFEEVESRGWSESLGVTDAPRLINPTFPSLWATRWIILETFNNYASGYMAPGPPPFSKYMYM